MYRALRDRQVQIWLLLLAATAVTGTVGLEGSASKVAGSILIAVAIFKLRLVALHFMEVADAPRVLRLLMEGYAGALLVVLVVIYLVG